MKNIVVCRRGKIPKTEKFYSKIAGRRYKNTLDLFLAPCLITFSAPILLFVSILIRLTSRGPIFISERRVGRNNKSFRCYKFRTNSGVEPIEIPQNRYVYNEGNLTYIGYWLRRLGIDELPQLFNVLKGDMSLVGPRPYRTLTESDQAFFVSIKQDHDKRHAVRPGITGWAQVNGYRGLAPNLKLEKWHLSQRLKYDLYYVENCSIWLDLKILLMTFSVISSKKTHRSLEKYNEDCHRA